MVVSSWDAHKKIRIDNDSIPEEILKLLQPNRRFHVRVNIGAESHEDLFFVSWESDVGIHHPDNALPPIIRRSAARNPTG